MAHITQYNAEKTTSFLLQKQHIEAEFFYELETIFNGGDLVERWKALARASMIYIEMHKAEPASKLDNWMKTHGFYSCIAGTQTNGWDRGRLLTKCNQEWRVADFGTWIRIFGELTEEGCIVSNENLINKQNSAKHGDKSHWSKPKIKTPSKTPLSSDLGTSSKRMRLEHKDLSPTDKEKFDGLNTVLREIISGDPNSGIKKWRVMDQDTCGKISRYCGLMRGATISGTTADNIYFMNLLLKGTEKKSSLLRMLPLATIPSGGHHSLLEVAFPLALAQVIPACGVGEYSKFHTAKGEDSTAASAITHHLRFCEDHNYNRLMLVYYDNLGKLEGSLVCETPEAKKAFFKMFGLNSNTMSTFRSLKPYPTYKDIEKLIKSDRTVGGLRSLL